MSRSLCAQQRGPLSQHFARCLEQARDLRRSQRARERQRRELRSMQDFIRIRIADAAEQPRIRQASLQRVALDDQTFCEFIQDASQHIDATWIGSLQPFSALDEMQ